jgi:hypothetical protein
MAHHIHRQVHDKFKIFSGDLAADGTIGKLADEVSVWVNKSKVAPKSIGVAYLEHGKRLVLTLGYIEDGEPYGVKLHSLRLGKFDVKDNDFRALEEKMAHAGAKHSNIICHELYVTGDNDFTVVVMTHEAK